MAPPMDTSAEAGMSRAAKRRSKKRQKKSHEPDTTGGDFSKKARVALHEQQAHPSPQDEHEDDIEDENDIMSVSDVEDVKVKQPIKVKSIEKSRTKTRLRTGVTRLLQLLEDDDSVDETAHDRAASILSFLTNMPLEEFYKNYFEKKPLLVQARNRDRFDGLLSLGSLQTLFEKHTHFYGRDLNITRYETQKDGIKRRTTLDSSIVGESVEKQVDSSIWSDYFHQGCTIRLLCPQKHNESIFAVLSHLETEFGCMVGSNAYLTPPEGSQGFAPHYDDIEAFCLQLEGKKRWKVYAPLSKAERLPRVSSEDYVAADLDHADPVIDVVLEAGDMLYMPRGWIHQACTLPESEEGDKTPHSLHLTISAMQQWAWIDLMEIIIPEALQSVATGESLVLRQGLPRNFCEYMGAMHDVSDDKTPDVLKRREDDESVDSVVEDKKKRKEEFCAQAKRRIALIAKEAIEMVDAACDQIGKRFLSERLPPALSMKEKAETDGGRSDSLKIRPDMMCRLARPGIARLVIEEGKAVLYHCNDNSRVFMERPLSPLDFELDDAPAMEQLLTTVEPRWIMVADLFHDTIDDKVGVAQALYDEGILAVHIPTS